MKKLVTTALLASLCFAMPAMAGHTKAHQSCKNLKGAALEKCKADKSEHKMDHQHGHKSPHAMTDSAKQHRHTIKKHQKALQGEQEAAPAQGQ